MGVKQGYYVLERVTVGGECRAVFINSKIRHGTMDLGRRSDDPEISARTE